MSKMPKMPKIKDDNHFIEKNPDFRIPNPDAPELNTFSS